MGPTSDTIGVRTKHDREEEEHVTRLMERIMQENRNPFQTFVNPILDQASSLYSTYLYSSGVMFLMLAFWGLYPSFVRFRHAHLLRYRQRQISIRRGLFGTEHLPKWNKKYLQRIVVPPIPTPELRAVGPATPSFLQTASSWPSDATSSVSLVPTADAGGLVRPASDSCAPFAVMELTATRTSRASFGTGDAENSERALIRELYRINRDFFGSKSHLFGRPIQEADASADLQTRLKGAVAAAKAVIVLKEDHRTVRSIPKGWEVWWVSEPEARRRKFCKFWLCGLACARAFQDLMDMPDMPDFIN
ncbi:hypothetical protein JKF63_02365 [Porcisia hertigi]|uniref:Uncharacterized protein n=1 Tax=Porcisia hertigi TaxID=2761500 RepID=A0A836I0V0_9TRYP|nr:hypothetical protein JKF63_02365 [Porcisia hertigi]